MFSKYFCVYFLKTRIRSCIASQIRKLTFVTIHLLIHRPPSHFASCPSNVLYRPRNQSRIDPKKSENPDFSSQHHTQIGGTVLAHIQSQRVGPNSTPSSTPGSFPHPLRTTHTQETRNLKNKVQTLFCFFIKAPWPLGFFPLAFLTKYNSFSLNTKTSKL